MKHKLTYLAIPYTWNAEKSFELANKLAAKFMTDGKVIFSPVSHSHKIADHLEELRFSQSFWMKQDLSVLDRCDEMIVVVIGKNGKELIKQSKGCQSEIAHAKEKGIPIYYYDSVCEVMFQ